MGIKRVLIRVKRASVENRKIRTGPESHCLMFFWTGCVYESHIHCYKPSSSNS
ncbi:hypothetical protein HanPSC8_Chr10g0442441 [Helianthus annuus]|nr:hypothetical protein HanPSC8_Chr10g0442441 [Helianthus annuus]